LTYGKITPTDIDGFLDFGNKLFVFIEVKYGDAALPTGQRLALERICDACQKAGIVSVVAIASHDSATQDIDVAGAMVTRYRYDGKWQNFKPGDGYTVRQFIDRMREFARLT